MRTQKRRSSAQLNSAFQAIWYRCSIITLIPKSEISCLQLFSVAVQPCLCRAWSENDEDRVFSRWGSNDFFITDHANKTITNLKIKSHVLANIYSAVIDGHGPPGKI